MSPQNKNSLQRFLHQRWAHITTTILIATILVGGWSVYGASEEQANILKVVDGDTIHVQLPDGKKEKVRIIGIDTPETKDPRKPVQCFGKEASKQMSKLVNGKTVVLERNPAEDRDKYKRLLRYISLNGEDIGASMVRGGYAFSYKKFPHPRLATYNQLEREARGALRGLWGSACDYQSTTPVSGSKTSPNPPIQGECKIKGNISKEKIYHLPGCGSYKKTIIETDKGERWFCTEAEAVAAGWRKAGNC